MERERMMSAPAINLRLCGLNFKLFQPVTTHHNQFIHMWQEIGNIVWLLEQSKNKYWAVRSGVRVMGLQTVKTLDWSVLCYELTWIVEFPKQA